MKCFESDCCFVRSCFILCLSYFVVDDFYGDVVVDVVIVIGFFFGISYGFFKDKIGMICYMC